MPRLRPGTVVASTTPTTALPATVPEPETFNDGHPLPKVIAFDLDYTLWPFWVDTHVDPPLKATDNGLKVKDRYGESFGFYNDVGGVLEAARSHSLKIAAASRTCAPALANDMLRLLRIPSSSDNGTSKKAIEYFDHLQIFPGSKIRHFERLHDATGIDYKEMVFFDDESRNKDVESLGVVMYLVRDGVTREEVDKGVRAWRKKWKKSGC